MFDCIIARRYELSIDFENFPNSKLGFSLLATEAEYKKSDFHIKIRFFVSGSLQKMEKPQTTNLGKYISCKYNIRHAQKCFRFALIKSERKSEYKISGTSHKYFYKYMIKIKVDL